MMIIVIGIISAKEKKIRESSLTKKIASNLRTAKKRCLILMQTMMMKRMKKN